MTPQEMLDELNRLQKDIWVGGTKEQKEQFKKIAKDLQILGFKPICRRIRSLGQVVSVYWEMRRKSEIGEKYVGEWIVDEHEKNCNSECTTRAIYFCMNHTIPYQQIRDYQNRTSRQFFMTGRCKGWNNMSTVRQVLYDYGFDRVEIPCRRFYSGVLALKLKELDTKVILKTAHHLSACYKGAVVDDWDSRRKKVEEIYVKSEMVENVKYALGL